MLGYFRDTSVKDEEIALKPGKLSIYPLMVGIIVKGDPQSDNTTFVTMKYQDSSHSY